MFTSCVLFALALSADPVSAIPTADPAIPICEIVSIDDQSVPGSDAGVLTIMTVKEGMSVVKGAEIGRVDDSEAQAQLAVRRLEYDVANSTATSDIEVRHAEAAAEVAQAALQKLQESNDRFKGTVTSIDILRAQLEHKKSKLAIEQAAQKKIEAELTAKAKSAEVGAAKVALDRRVLRAPFDGVVVKVSKKPGEWVAPGEPVVQIVGVNRLRVMGNLDASDWGPADIDGRDVTVEVTLPRGRAVKVPGKVTFVSPVVTLGQLPVWAEIAPSLEVGLPVVRAGLRASMTIHASRPVTKPATAPSTPAKAAGAPSTTTKGIGTPSAGTAKAGTGASTTKSAPPATSPSKGTATKSPGKN
jgi:multidrug efflux pump subunit AcrA (membrane-fusion protein)